MDTGPSAMLPPPPTTAAASAPAVDPVDRSKVCPFLLRVFPRFGAHHPVESYNQRNHSLPPNEFQFYTWADATLRELTDLLKEIQASARKSNARIEFAIVYPDRRGTFVMRQIGTVTATRSGEDDLKTLKELAFQTGDYLDVAIYPY